MIGRTLAHFRIEEKLGAGGMGTVYRAFDLELERTVALKVLASHALADDEARGRFRREARAASALNHAGIVTVHEIGCEDGVDFLVMERVEGRTLLELCSEGRIEPVRAVAFALQVAEALAAAHEKGVIHRDLKPGNLMVTPEDRVKILDFGLAKQLGCRAESASGGPPVASAEQDPTQRIEERLLTASGMIVGTPQYMSPEQAEAGRVDARSDVFSFGCILYQLLAGRSPFEGATPLAVLTRILRDEPVPLAERRSGLPSVLSRLVADCLEKDPKRRPASAAELLEPLRQAYQELGGESRSLTPAPRVWSLRGRRRGWGLVAAGIVGTIGLGLGLWLSRPAPLRVDSKAPEAPMLRASGFRAVSGHAGEWGARFSPEGRMLAFLRQDAAGVPQLWVRGLAGGDPLQVTSGERPVRHLAWTPKGDHLIFAREGEGIWSAPALGGGPRRLVESGRHPDVDPVSGRLVFERGDGLWLAAADGSGARILSEVPVGYFSQILGLDASFSPDGRSIVCFLMGDDPTGDLWVASVEGGPLRRLTHQQSQGGGPSWTADGRAIVYSSEAGGALNLWWVSAAGGEPRPLTAGAGEDSQPTLAPDGRSVVYTNQRTRFALLRRYPESGRDDLLVEQPTPIVLPSVSPDGGRVAYFGPTPSGVHLFVVGSDGANRMQVSERVGSRQVSPRWSADGASLYYYRQTPTASFSRVPADGGESEVLVDGWSWTRENGAAVDAKGERVAYSLWEGAELIAARVRELASGREWALGKPMLGALWSPDGENVYGSTPQGELWRCPSEGGDCRSVGTGSYPRWGPDRRLYVMRVAARDGDSHGIEIWSLSAEGPAEAPESGAGERRVAKLDGVEQLYFAFDVLPDGSIVWNRVQRGARELWMADLAWE
jgi:Tol biopolymer transport system component/predicted Ser/Thr protein kinase